jgi:hypothetical protein
MLAEFIPPDLQLSRQISGIPRHVTSGPPRKDSSSAALWILSALVGCWLLAMGFTLLPPRARPLLLLPLLFGLVAGGMLEWLRNAMNGPLTKLSRGLIPVLAAGCLAVILHTGYREFQDREKLGDKDEAAHLFARQMVEAAGKSDPDLLRRFEEDEASRRPTWNRYLMQKYAPLGAWTRGVPLVLMGIEFVLAAAGASVARSLVRRQAHPMPTRSDGLGGLPAEQPKADSTP